MNKATARLATPARRGYGEGFSPPRRPLRRTTTGQFHELLDLLSSTTYQVPGKNIGIPEDTVQITLDPHARVFFHSGGRHMELILPGNLILVNPLAFPGKSRTYLPDGNQEFQQDVIAFLESCQNGA